MSNSFKLHPKPFPRGVKIFSAHPVYEHPFFIYIYFIYRQTTAG